MTITETEHDQSHIDEAVAGATGTDIADAARDPLGELLHVDPRDLIVGANVRGVAQLDRAFLRSVADRGVRERIIVRRRDGGVLVVRKGKRRTMAAIEVGRATVPVLVEPGTVPEDSDRAGQIERIVDQLEENLHRAGNTDVEEVLAHQELLDLGLSAGQIARRTHSSTKHVRVTTAIARSELASAVLATYDLTLDQAAVIAEFDDGTPDSGEAVKLLTVTAQKDPRQFEHVTQRLRDDRADSSAIADRIAELTTAGIRVLDPDAVESAAQISGLRPEATDPNGTELTPEAHAGCPGHAAQVEIRRGWDREANLRTVYWCTDPTGNGHTARWNRISATGSDTGSRQLGPLNETEKAERRRVIANNKAWDSATTVRRDWLRGFLARKTAPRNAAQFIAATLGRGGHDLRKAMETGHPTACELLAMAASGSVYTGHPSPIAVAAGTAGTPRATILALAVLLGAAEDAISRQTWRSPSADNRTYFTALAEWGYPLSAVEHLVLNPDGPADAAPAEAFTAADILTDSDPDGACTDDADGDVAHEASSSGA